MIKLLIYNVCLLSNDFDKMNYLFIGMLIAYFYICVMKLTINCKQLYSLLAEKEGR